MGLAVEELERLLQGDAQFAVAVPGLLGRGRQQRLVDCAAALAVPVEVAGGDAGEAGDDLKQALEELRELARGLHSAVLTDRGLAPALQSLANRAPFPVEITGIPARRLPEAVEAAVYYVVAESLTNTASTPTPPKPASKCRHQTRPWSWRSATTVTAAECQPAAQASWAR